MVAFGKQFDLGKQAKKINSCFRFCTCLPPSRFWAHCFFTSHNTRLWLKVFLPFAVIFPWNRSQCICMLPHPSLTELEETLDSKKLNCCSKCAAKSWLDWSQWWLHSHRAWISDLGMYLHHAVGCCSYTCSLHQINPTFLLPRISLCTQLCPSLCHGGVVPLTAPPNWNLKVGLTSAWIRLWTSRLVGC